MAAITWVEAGHYTDILYHKAEGIAKIAINRPEVRNAFRRSPSMRWPTPSTTPDSIPPSASSS